MKNIRLFIVRITFFILLHCAASFIFSTVSCVTPRATGSLNHILSINDLKNRKEYVWEEAWTKPFNELIVSWNAKRPPVGKFVFYVSLKNGKWAPWRKLAQWGAKGQKTFVNTKDKYIHTKHVRIETQKKVRARGFRIKVVAQGGASLNGVKALFASLSRLNQFKIEKFPYNFSSKLIKGVPRCSQMWVDHERRGDFCSPTSTSIIIRYLNEKLDCKTKKQYLPLRDQVKVFAKQTHDDSYLDIHGNWVLNVAQAYDDTNGRALFKVARLNSFEELHGYLRQNIPVAVSIRGKLRGGYKNYKDGHFVVVVGWSQKKQAVLCIDPVFRNSRQMLRGYRVSDFMKAWGRSKNLSYIAMPQRAIS
jgi:hypothetical protein